MPTPFTVSFKFAGQSYDNVVLTWGEGRGRTSGVAHLFGGRDYPEQVPDTGDAGADWTVGLPAVLALLTSVERGEATATQAREVLTKAVGTFSVRSGCCPDCDGSVEDYNDALVRHRQSLARFDEPVTYPYLVTSRTIHAWDCPRMTDAQPVHPGETVSAWVHSRSYYVRDHGPDRLTTGEAIMWMKELTGPQGGQNWKRCRVCQPELPGAWDSEANSTSNANPVTT